MTYLWETKNFSQNWKISRGQGAEGGSLGSNSWIFLFPNIRNRRVFSIKNCSKIECIKYKCPKFFVITNVLETVILSGHRLLESKLAKNCRFLVMTQSPQDPTKVKLISLQCSPGTCGNVHINKIHGFRFSRPRNRIFWSKNHWKSVKIIKNGSSRSRTQLKWS